MIQYKQKKYAPMAYVVLFSILWAESNKPKHCSQNALGFFPLCTLEQW